MVRFAGQQIQSWNPSQDGRSIENGVLYVLDGRNYLFDAKGPKSGFGSRLMFGRGLGNGTDIQAVDVGDQTIVMSSKGMWRQEYKYSQFRDVLEPTTNWNQLAEFNETKTAVFNSGRWTGAFLNGQSYVGHQNHGLYRVQLNNAVLHDVDGVPAEPVAIGVTAGRLIVLSKDIFAWSGTGDGSDFVPQLGGAGFVSLDQYMAETPIGITTFAQGLVVWGNHSAMLVEYIGGESVFRFDTLQTRLYPYGPMSITSDANGRSFMMTRHGIAVVQAGQIDDQSFVAFNEFLRTYLNNNADSKFRLDYVLEDDILYVQIADANDFYTDTYAFSVNIGKWGRFNDPHLGFCRFGAPTGTSGYADIKGRPHKITDTPDREVFGKGLRGLDSKVIVGYFNDPRMVMEADTILEMQELVVSARFNFPSEEIMEVYDWGAKGYWSLKGLGLTEDWNVPLPVPPDIDGNDWNIAADGEEFLDDDSDDDGEDEIIDDDGNNAGEGFFNDSTVDYNEPGTGQDWNIGPLQYYQQFNTFDSNLDTPLLLDEDLNFVNPEVLEAEPEHWEDWNDDGDPDEDYMGPYSFIDSINYQIEVQSSMNGFDDDINTDPELAMDQLNRDHWTMISSGRFQAVMFAALEVGEKYHLTSLDATLVYQGQYS